VEGASAATPVPVSGALKLSRRVRPFVPFKLASFSCCIVPTLYFFTANSSVVWILYFVPPFSAVVCELTRQDCPRVAAA